MAPIYYLFNQKLFFDHSFCFLILYNASAGDSKVLNSNIKLAVKHSRKMHREYYKIVVYTSAVISHLNVYWLRPIKQALGELLEI